MEGLKYKPKKQYKTKNTDLAIQRRNKRIKNSTIKLDSPDAILSINEQRKKVILQKERKSKKIKKDLKKSKTLSLMTKNQFAK